MRLRAVSDSHAHSNIHAAAYRYADTDAKSNGYAPTNGNSAADSDPSDASASDPNAYGHAAASLHSRRDSHDV